MGPTSKPVPLPAKFTHHSVSCQVPGPVPGTFLLEADVPIGFGVTARWGDVGDSSITCVDVGSCGPKGCEKWRSLSSDSDSSVGESIGDLFEGAGMSSFCFTFLLTFPENLRNRHPRFIGAGFLGGRSSILATCQFQLM